MNLLFLGTHFKYNNENLRWRVVTKREITFVWLMWDEFWSYLLIRQKSNNFASQLMIFLTNFTFLWLWVNIVQLLFCLKIGSHDWHSANFRSTGYHLPIWEQSPANFSMQILAKNSTRLSSLIKCVLSSWFDVHQEIFNISEFLLIFHHN